VSATSATDVWAVGTTGSTVDRSTFAVHWNGSAWTQVATPSPGTRESVLNGVAGTSSTDVWAVGYYRDLPYGNRVKHSLILHWNGSAWSQVPSPDFAAGNQVTVLSAVAVSSPTDAWAVGAGSVGTVGSLVLHWDGVSWHRVAAPPLDQVNGAAVVSGNLWLTGSSASEAKVARREGTGWIVTTPPAAPAGSGTLLHGIAAAGTNTAITVGGVSDNSTGIGRPTALRVTA
jgi:hypothetical protein